MRINIREGKALIDAMAMWPRLECLSVYIAAGSHERDAAIFQRLVNSLIPRRCHGTVHLPRLRHLGIMGSAADHNGCPEWAAKPYTNEDKVEWGNFLSRSTGRRPLYPSDILDLESQRRKLHQDGADCDALESIKIRAFEILPGGWSMLQRRSEARLACEPDPATSPFY